VSLDNERRSEVEAAVNMRLKMGIPNGKLPLGEEAKYRGRLGFINKNRTAQSIGRHFEDDNRFSKGFWVTDGRKETVRTSFVRAGPLCERTIGEVDISGKENHPCRESRKDDSIKVREWQEARSKVLKMGKSSVLHPGGAFRFLPAFLKKWEQ